MPASVAHIIRDISRPATFMIRMYKTVQDIGVKVPIDSWEAKMIIADQPTIDYLNNLEVVKIYRERSRENGENNKTYRTMDE